MATIREWEKELKQKSDIELLEIQHALNILKKWTFFEYQFGPALLRLAVKLAVENLTRR